WIRWLVGRWGLCEGLDGLQVGDADADVAGVPEPPHPHRFEAGAGTELSLAHAAAGEVDGALDQFLQLAGRAPAGVGDLVLSGPDRAAPPLYPVNVPPVPGRLGRHAGLQLAAAPVLPPSVRHELQAPRLRA